MTLDELKAEISERIADKQELLDVLSRRTKDYHIIEGEIIAYLNVLEMLEEVEVYG